MEEQLVKFDNLQGTPGRYKEALDFADFFEKQYNCGNIIIDFNTMADCFNNIIMIKASKPFVLNPSYHSFSANCLFLLMQVNNIKFNKKYDKKYCVSYSNLPIKTNCDILIETSCPMDLRQLKTLIL